MIPFPAFICSASTSLKTSAVQEALKDRWQALIGRIMKLLRGEFDIYILNSWSLFQLGIYLSGLRICIWIHTLKLILNEHVWQTVRNHLYWHNTDSSDIRCLTILSAICYENSSISSLKLIVSVIINVIFCFLFIKVMTFNTQYNTWILYKYTKYFFKLLLLIIIKMLYVFTFVCMSLVNMVRYL